MIEYILAEEKDAPEILEMMNEIYENMEEKAWFFMDDEEAVRRQMVESGFALKAVVDGKLAGVFVVFYPGVTEKNLGNYMGFDKDNLMKTAHMEIAMVRQEYRGLGIQHKIMEKAEEILKDTGYVHLMATVHPDNIYSANNVKKLGYTIVAKDLMYGGVPRNIFYKKI